MILEENNSFWKTRQMPPATMPPGEDPGSSLLWSKCSFPASWTASWSGTLGKWVNYLVVPWVVISLNTGEGAVQVVAAGLFMPPGLCSVSVAPCRSLWNLRGTPVSHICHLICTHFVPSLVLNYFVSLSDSMSNKSQGEGYMCLTSTLLKRS